MLMPVTQTISLHGTMLLPPPPPIQAAMSHISEGDEATVLVAEAERRLPVAALAVPALPEDGSFQEDSATPSTPGRAAARESPRSPRARPGADTSDLLSPRQYGDARPEESSTERAFHLKSTVQLLRAACVDLVGRPAFEELYALMKRQADAADNDSSGASVTELSRQVFKIIPYDKSEAVPLLYRLLYSEAQLDG
jgi:hypothetical protein